MDKHDTIGQDCVVCVNDIACSGAKPLFFLDYIAPVRMFRKRLHKSLKALRTAVFCRVARL